MTNASSSFLLFAVIVLVFSCKKGGDPVAKSSCVYTGQTWKQEFNSSSYHLKYEFETDIVSDDEGLPLEYNYTYSGNSTDGAGSQISKITEDRKLVYKYDQAGYLTSISNSRKFVPSGSYSYGS